MGGMEVGIRYGWNGKVGMGEMESLVWVWVGMGEWKGGYWNGNGWKG